MMTRLLSLNIVSSSVTISSGKRDPSESCQCDCTRCYWQEKTNSCNCLWGYFSKYMYMYICASFCCIVTNYELFFSFFEQTSSSSSSTDPEQPFPSSTQSSSSAAVAAVFSSPVSIWFFLWCVCVCVLCVLCVCAICIAPMHVMLCKLLFLY